MPFHYLADPLFRFCLALYAVNRWVLEPLFPGGFFGSYLNDLICLPFWVPLMVWGLRRLGLRSDDTPPQWYELLLPLVVWSAVFELWLPRASGFRAVAYSDPADILCYAVGGVAAAAFWHWQYRPAQPQTTCPILEA